jgi:hypothetical protein
MSSNKTLILYYVTFTGEYSMRVLKIISTTEMTEIPWNFKQVDHMFIIDTRKIS